MIENFVCDSTNQVDGLQVVVGLGGSGLSAVNYLLSQGYRVAVTDSGIPTLATQLPTQVLTKFSGIDAELLTQAHRIIISPGINPNLPVFSQAKNLGIPFVNDIQLFHEICQQRQIPIIAITGSNAKSTVTTLVGEMVIDAGKKVGVGGNLGTPALDLLQQPLELAVLELSSFQLEIVHHLNAQVATILNMSPDHLDRHGDMLGYQQAKQRIFQGVKSVVINRNDENSYPIYHENVSMISFGYDVPQEGQYGLIIDDGIWLARGNDKLLHESELLIKGEHNLMNALSALALGELANLPLESMLKTLKRFTGLPHRCQFVASIHGLDCYDDSKGTNIGSTIAAILGLGKVYAPKGKKLAVILGGQGKGQNFIELSEPLLQYASHLYLIGQDAHVIANDLAKLNDYLLIKQSDTLENAIEQAWQDADIHQDLGVLLLSPACASLDQFKDYHDRGQQFQQLVLTKQSNSH